MLKIGEGALKMKRLFLGLLVVFSSCSLCFGQQGGPADLLTRDVPGARTTTATGTISVIILGDDSKGVKSQVSITNSYINNISFSVSGETVIIGRDGEEIETSDLKKGDKIAVGYILGKKVNRAQSIKVMK